MHLRALGRVLGDLSELGYDAQWHGLRAADVGAAHGRFRVFVIATDATSDAWGFGHGDGGAAAIADRLGLERTRSARAGWAGSADGSLMPTPRATDGTKGGPGQRGSSGDLMLPSAVAMLPTPQARDHKGYGPADSERHDPNLSAIPLLLPTPTVGDSKSARNSTARRNVLPPTGIHAGNTLTDALVPQLLPTPSAQLAKGSQTHRSGARTDELLLDGVAAENRWGDYAVAIARWESVIGRPAPEPTQTSTKGNPQLSAAFVEWLMGLPAGWVTDVPGITRNEALKALGNGVVPQQATEALRIMLDRLQAAA